MRRIILFVFGVMFAVAVLGGGLGVLLVLNHYSADLPDFRDLANYEPPVTTRFYAADGKLIAEYAEERRLFVPIEAIPRRVINAFIAAEDKTFYQHPGIDFRGVIRALIQNMSNVGSGKRLVGASTITQQVAKNFLLGNEVSVERKLREAILAFRIERAFTKDQILELYFNEIFLGLNSYGVAAAALNYFNKAVSELTVAEAAYLGALPKGPNNYHPERNREAAVARRNWVIDRMHEEGFLITGDVKTAKEEELRVRKPYRGERARADFFSEAVRRQLVDTYGRERVYRGGLSVRTTLDSRLQKIAEQSLQEGLISYDRRHGWRGPIVHLMSLNDWVSQLRDMKRPDMLDKWQVAVVLEVHRKQVVIGFAEGHTGRISMKNMKWARPTGKNQLVGPTPVRPAEVLRKGDVVAVELIDASHETYALRQIPDVQGAVIVMDPHTGRVLAMQGGFTFSQEGNSFNRAIQAWRQPGSAFKPFVYLAALEKGYAPNTIILDAPFVLCQQIGRPCWRPENYSSAFYGPTPMRVGIERSRNLMTIRLAQNVGMRSVREVAMRFGVVDDMQLFLPLALGAGETTVLRLTAAYGMIANGGRRIESTLLDRLQDRHGRTIFRHDRRPCPGCRVGSWNNQYPPVLEDAREQIMSRATAYQMVSMLEGVVKRGTGRSIASLGRPIAGKTGTTNDYFDSWFVGFTPDLVVGVFVGFDRPRTLGNREAGSAVAAPIFKQIMRQALQDVPPRPFSVPKGVRLVPIDLLSGTKCSIGAKGCVLEVFKPGSEPEEVELAGSDFGRSTVVIEGDLADAQIESVSWPSFARAPEITPAGAGAYPLPYPSSSPYPPLPTGAQPYVRAPIVDYYGRRGVGAGRTVPLTQPQLGLRNVPNPAYRYNSRPVGARYPAVRAPGTATGPNSAAAAFPPLQVPDVRGGNRRPFSGTNAPGTGTGGIY